jgi:hypothetical protein
MELKGKATLILTDNETGREVFRETHKNTITPALSRIFGTNISGCLNYNKLMPVISKLLGGVCLFNGNVSASDIFLPKEQDATLTAHAGQSEVFDASQDAKRGFINRALSGDIQNGYKWVWQWTTTGNGLISDVVLTHADTGDFWNESTPNMMASYFSPVGDVCSRVVTPLEFKVDNSLGFPRIANQNKIPLGFIDDENRAVSVEVASGKLIVHVGKFTGSGAWIWNNLAEIEDELTYDWTPTPYTVGNMTCSFYVALDADNKKIYAIYAGSSSAPFMAWGRSLSVNVLDLQTGTSTNSTIDLSATLDAYQNYESLHPDYAVIPSDALPYAKANNQAGELKQLQIVNGSIFLPVLWYKGGLGPLDGPTDCSIRVNLTNTNDKEIVKGLYGYYFLYDDDTNGQIELGNGRVLNPETIAWKDSSGDYKGQAVMRNTDVFRSIYLTYREFCAKLPADNPIQFFVAVDADGSADGIRGCVLNKLYAATVFHIENGPVTKTANRTMTLEYEITQEEIES